MKKDKNDLTFQEHFRELRNRFLLCIIVFVVMAIVMCVNSQWLLNLFLGIGIKSGFKFVYLTPQEMLIQSLRLALNIALFFSMPIAFTEVLLFIMPIFYSKTSRLIAVLCMIFSIVCFVAGIVFSVRVLLPFIFGYLNQYSSKFLASGTISVSQYLSFFLTISLMLGFVFEMPVVTAILSLGDVIKASMMVKSLRFVVIVIAIVAAIITPPDVVSMLMVLIPMIGIYCLSIFVCFVLQGRSDKSEKCE